MLFTFNSLAVAQTDIHKHHYEIKKSAKAKVIISPQVKDQILDITLNIDGKLINFVLQDNEQLAEFKSRAKSERNVRFLLGRIKGIKNSWARFRLLNGKLNGVYYDGQNLQLLEQSEKYGRNASPSSKESAKNKEWDSDSEQQLIVFNPSDVVMSGACANHAQSSSNLIPGSAFNYNTFVEDLNSSVASSTLLGATSETGITVIADQSFINGSATYYEDLLSHINFAQGVFASQVGVQLRLDEIIEFTDTSTLNTNDPYTLLPQLTQLYLPHYGLRHLFTGRELDGTTVGIAYVSQLCNDFSAGVTQSFGSLTGLIFAHELGHNFGAPHDNQSNSACQTTPSGYVMNPVINAAGDSFSACSLEQIEPVLTYYQNVYNSCFSPIAFPPQIVSTPGLTGDVAVAYQYDPNNIVDINASSDVSFNLDIAPDGMTLSQTGELSWTPMLSDVGIVPVQISITNAEGSDTQYFEITVENPINGEPINFAQEEIKTYWGQPGKGTTTVSTNEIELQGNIWSYIPQNNYISESTLIEFEFKSDVIADIHGIGFMTDATLLPELFFNLAGTENFGIRDFTYTQEGQYQKFIIPIGKFFTGEFKRILFAADNDGNNLDVNTHIRNLVIYNDTDDTNYDTQPPKIRSTATLNAIVGEAYAYDEDSKIGVTSSHAFSLNLDIAPAGMTLAEDGILTWLPNNNDQGILPVQITASNLYGSDTQYFEITVGNSVVYEPVNFNETAPNIYWGQPGVGTTIISEEGTEIFLDGNNWQYILLMNDVNQSTVLQFDFKSDTSGEVHGIGLMKDATLQPETFFKLYGNENFGITDFIYTEIGEYQTFTIPIGRYFTGTFQRILLANDNDNNNPSVNTSIRNIKVYNEDIENYPIEPPRVWSEPSLNAIVGEAYQYDADSLIGVTATNDYQFSLDIAPSGMSLTEEGKLLWTPSLESIGINPVQITVTNADGSDTQNFDVVVENQQDGTTINFSQVQIYKYWGQPGVGTMQVSNGGNELILDGNNWQYILMANEVDASTVLEFEFRSDSLAEIHGIGLMKDANLVSDTFFKLAGSEDFGINDFSYEKLGEYQTFSIPIGQYFSGKFNRILFAVDNDANEESPNTIIRNLKIINAKEQ